MMSTIPNRMVYTGPAQWAEAVSRIAQTFVLPSGKYMSEVPGEHSWQWWEIGDSATESRVKLEKLLRTYFHRLAPTEAHD